MYPCVAWGTGFFVMRIGLSRLPASFSCIPSEWNVIANAHPKTISIMVNNLACALQASEVAHCLEERGYRRFISFFFLIFISRNRFRHTHTEAHVRARDLSSHRASSTATTVTEQKQLVNKECACFVYHANTVHIPIDAFLQNCCICTSYRLLVPWVRNNSEPLHAACMPPHAACAVYMRARARRMNHWSLLMLRRVSYEPMPICILYRIKCQRYVVAVRLIVK